MPDQIYQLFSSPQFIVPLLVWSGFWKALALWRAANNHHLIWFVVLFVLNTAGLLEIAYIFYLHRWDIDNGRMLAFLTKKFKKLR